VTFSSNGWDDYQYWLAADQKILDRVNSIIRETMRDPTGRSHKAEKLKGDLSGFSSKRINREHRMVYRLRGSGADQVLEILQLRFHY
jgi:toxin YoeB